MTLNQTVILKENGDVGKIVEFDNQGRTHCVHWRHGYSTWHYPEDLAAI